MRNATINLHGINVIEIEEDSNEGVNWLRINFVTHDERRDLSISVFSDNSNTGRPDVFYSGYNISQAIKRRKATSNSEESK